MIIDIKGSLFKDAPKGSLVGIPVNTIGVTGKGMANYMAIRWPEARDYYYKECRRGRMSTGELKTFITDDFRLAFIPTKYHWRNGSTTAQIDDSLRRLVDFMTLEGISEVHLPELGCGEKTGGLDYRAQVAPLIEKHFPEEPYPAAYVYHWR